MLLVADHSHAPQEQGQPRLGRLPDGKLQLQPGRGERLLPHLEHLPEPVHLLPQQGPEEQSELGIRIDPGETHARDSACVLVQAGSDDNYYADNDITYGGDGVFIRVYAGWTTPATCSSGTTPRTPTTIASRPSARATPIATTRPTTAATVFGWAGRTRRSWRTTRPVTTVCSAGSTTPPGASRTCRAGAKRRRRHHHGRHVQPHDLSRQ